MEDPYIGEIRLFAGAFAPRGWAECNGQLLPVAQNSTLFGLLGDTYGGDGTTTFALPNLQGASPVGVGEGPGLTEVVRGRRLGAPTVTLVEQQMPAHTHQVIASDAVGTTDNPSGATWARSRRGRASELLYGPVVDAVDLAPDAVAPAGGGQAHENMPPYLVTMFVIALTGLYPTRP